MASPHTSPNKSLDLLLVHPSFTNVYQQAQEAMDYPALEPPYRAALTAEFVRNNGYSVEILESNVLGLSAEESAKRAHETKPGLIQIEVHGNHPSASSQLMDWVTTFNRTLKELDAGHKVLLTGTHPAALPQRTLLENSGDYVGRGDGFHTTLGLLQSGNVEKVPGLWYMRDGQAMQGAPMKLLEPGELNASFKRAAWDLLPIKDYRAHDWHCLEDLDQRQPYMSIYTGFGCFFNCDFCCINAPFNEGGLVKNKIRNRDPKLVVDEIEEVARMHGATPQRRLNLKIIDEMFVFDQRHYTAIAREIIGRGLGDSLNTWAYARVDTVKEGNLEILKRAGFNWLALGIESGSKHVRDGVDKGRFVESDMMKVVKAIQDHGIYIVGNYIFGLPDDNQETMQQTYDLAVELKCERPNFYSAMAYPGSGLHRMATEGKYPLPQGWDNSRPLLPEDTHKGGPGWIGYSQHGYNTLNLPTAHLLPEQVLAYRDSAMVKYFSDPAYLARVASQFGDHTARKFKEMNAITPKRKLLECAK
ncbi:MAG: radical SAM protein [Nanoarchaeota archaeon]|nr:radical SAM protein [Nanoarchaeota archaeon]